MAKKSIECLASEGNFSKSKISMILFGVVSIAVLIFEKTSASPNEKYEWKKIASSFRTCSLDENNGIEYQNIQTFKECKKLADQRNGTTYIYYDSSMHCVLFKACNKMEMGSFMDSPGATYKKNEDGNKWNQYTISQKSCNFISGDFIHYYPDLTFRKCKELGNNHNGWNYIFRYFRGGCSFFKNCNEETRVMPKSEGLTYEKQIKEE